MCIFFGEKNVTKSKNTFLEFTNILTQILKFNLVHHISELFFSLLLENQEPELSDAMQWYFSSKKGINCSRGNLTVFYVADSRIFKSESEVLLYM